ncbi:uncharacterized protein LOC111024871 [Momordica charantia]|uniref:Uncharacterized protein LOC111024871 n=1 Tax=Momordica charantia TaxID=3673 RepID=A0A6J1DX21_MOMCH|nr:uncharacterized protein LOC111024871 [Momordica charantia]
MLRACMLDFGGSWDKYLYLIEFAYNNSFQATIGMAPYEALYGKACRSPVNWDEVGERVLLGPDLVQATNSAIQKIRGSIQVAQSRQKSYADVRRRELEFVVGERVFLRVAPVKGIFAIWEEGQAQRKKYIHDPSHVLDPEPLQLDESLCYEEIPVRILARETKLLRNRTIHLVKVLWRNHQVEEATWEREDDIKAR